MKKLYSLALAYIFASCVTLSLAQTPDYGKTLFRVNTGGGTVPAANLPANDTTGMAWGGDNLNTKNPYITEADTVGTKTFGIPETEITLDFANTALGLPNYAFAGLFQNERGIYDWNKPMLSYNFPVAAGKKVEIVLYFAELYLENAGDRVMDINVEGVTVLDNFDIVAAAGAYKKGVVKRITATVGTDGNLDLDFVRVTQQPKVNAIEIIEIKDAVVQSLFTKAPETTLSAYPNPFKDVASIELNNIKPSDVKVFDSYGVEAVNASETNGTKVNVNLASYPTGVYFVTITDNNKAQTVRLIKQ